MKEKRFYNHCWYDDYVDHVIDRVTVNNITNVTNITNVYASGSRGEYGRRHSKRNRGRGRKRPELLTFFQSCGLLDRDRVMRMDDEQFTRGTVDVVRYSVDGLKHNVREIGDGVAQIGKCACDMGVSVAELISSILD